MSHPGLGQLTEIPVVAKRRQSPADRRVHVAIGKPRRAERDLDRLGEQLTHRHRDRAGRATRRVPHGHKLRVRPEPTAGQVERADVIGEQFPGRRKPLRGRNPKLNEHPQRGPVSERRCVLEILALHGGPYVPPDVDPPPPPDWPDVLAAGVVGDVAAGVVGEAAGGAMVSELLELLDGLLELLFALEDLADGLGELDESEPSELPLAVPSYDKPDDAPVSEEAPDDFTVACVDPGRRATTAPATATLAKDAVTVAAFSRRLPRSRSATACATRRAAAWPPARGVLAWSRGVPSPSFLLFMPISLTRVSVSAVRRRSQNALSSCSVFMLPAAASLRRGRSRGRQPDR